MGVLMRAGQLRSRIMVQQSTEAQSTSGEPQVSWILHARLNASVEAEAGSESVAVDDRTYGTQRYALVTRHYKGVTSAMRVLLPGATDRLFSPVDAESTSIEVWNGALPTEGGYLIRIDDELMLVTGSDDIGLVVTRNYQGTGSAAHEADATVTVMQPADILGVVDPDGRKRELHWTVVVRGE